MWADAPPHPDQVLEGTPRARSWDLHRARHGGVSMNYWDCTAGRFTWSYGGDEMVSILEGAVHITDAAGRTRTLQAGDTAHFEAGTTLTWDVPEYVRKLAFHRSPQTLADRVLSKVQRTAAPRRAIAAATAAGAVAIPVLAIL